MMNFSIWDSKKLKNKRTNPALRLGNVTIEFDRTKLERTFKHKLGSINFHINGNDELSLKLDKKRRREEAISQGLGNIGINGFKYKSVGHVYNKNIDIEPVINESGEYQWPVYAHGYALGGTIYAGKESCSKAGLICKSGEGEDDFCNPGKCLIGFLTRVKKTKWRYESYNIYNLNKIDSEVKEPVVYYLPQSESFTLKNILRGIYHNHVVPKRRWGNTNLSWDALSEEDIEDIRFSDFTYSGFEYNSDNKISIDRPASKKTKFFTPPVFYLEESFVDGVIAKASNREISGYETKKEKFIRAVVLISYVNTSEEFIGSKLEEEVEEIVKDKLIGVFADLPSVWYEKITEVIEQEFAYRFINNTSGFEFISSCYDILSRLFFQGIQVTENSFKFASLNYSKGLNARPVYSRLPGIAEAYRSDPSFSDSEPPAQWLTGGVDEFLSGKKDQITDFYENYLDPELCDPANLDWLAQHVGLFGNLWNTDWTREEKIALINNAYGWYDRELKVNIPESVKEIKTPKALALEKFPFKDNPAWSLESSRINNNRIVLSEIPKVVISEPLRYTTIEFKYFDGENYSETSYPLKMLSSQRLVFTRETFDVFRELTSEIIKGIKITKLNSIGTLQFTSDGGETWSNVVLDQTFSQEQLDSGYLRYIPDPDQFGPEYQTIKNKNQFFVKEIDQTTGITSLSGVETITFNKLSWNGLYETKGSLLNVAFLSSVFGLKSHSSSELEITDLEKNLFKPKSGLRQSEIESSILMPTKFDVVQVGNEFDAKTNNHANQLICGISAVSSPVESKNVFFRVPYYYNRNGISWNKVKYIAENWMPSNLNVRIQYPYLSADLWRVGDAFFELKYELDESTQ